MQQEIFSAFRKHCAAKVTAYLEDRNIHAKTFAVHQENRMRLKFIWQDKELLFSLHAYAHQNAVSVTLHTRFGSHELHDPIFSSNEARSYPVSTTDMNARLDRIMKDLKLQLEKYMFV